MAKFSPNLIHWRTYNSNWQETIVKSECYWSEEWLIFPHSLSIGAEEKQTVKARLLSSQMLLVDALYHLSPLLDCVISVGLLSRENRYEIEAERTPPNKARKLLEIVDAQMDESGASSFMECLRKCKNHYPRLRTWLTSEEGMMWLKLRSVLKHKCSSMM